jgi:maltose phosphorylase
MAGTWLSVVQGFGGMRIKKDKLSFEPFLPEQWSGFSFRVGFRKKAIQVSIKSSSIEIENLSTKSISVLIFGKEVKVEASSTKVVEY